MKPTFSNVSYGPDERNVLDFWKANGEGPRPLLMFIHGGGWTGGDKKKPVLTNDLESFLKKGISCASINYRLLGEASLPAPVHDAVRAIQFMRYRAKEWAIDKTRIALSGGSAGACTSMWILFHDEMANPVAKDPIQRESSRVLAVRAKSGQTSIDPVVIEPWLGLCGSFLSARQPF